MAKRQKKPTDPHEQIYDGEPEEIDPQRESIQLACCDCGLVHDLYLTVAHRRKVSLVMFRNNGATHHQRRRLGVKKPRGKRLG